MRAQLISITTAFQRFVAANRLALIKFFQATEVVVMIFTGAMVWLAVRDYDTWGDLLLTSGKTIGRISLILYVITLIPGIITRLQWQPAILQPIASAITPIRRHFGILTFLTAVMHSTFSLNLHLFLLIGPNPLEWSPEVFQVFGTLGILLLFPLWLTSNDFSVRKLGRNWKALHRLTYLALFFIFLHVAFQLSKWSVIPLIFLILEVVSWMVFWGRQKTSKQNQQSSLQVDAPSQPPKSQS